MEFAEFQVSWDVNQCRGACNADVADLEHIAKHTAALYAKACMELPPKERFFKVMRPNFKTIASAVSVMPEQPMHPMHDHEPLIEGDDKVDAVLEEANDNEDLAAAILNGRDLEAPAAEQVGDQVEVQEMNDDPMIIEMPEELRREIAQLEEIAIHVGNATPIDVAGDTELPQVPQRE